MTKFLVSILYLRMTKCIVRTSRVVSQGRWFLERCVGRHFYGTGNSAIFTQFCEYFTCKNFSKTFSYVIKSWVLCSIAIGPHCLLEFSPLFRHRRETKRKSLTCFEGHGSFPMFFGKHLNVEALHIQMDLKSLEFWSQL